MLWSVSITAPLQLQTQGIVIKTLSDHRSMQMNKTYFCISLPSSHFNKTGAGFCVKDQNNHFVHKTFFLFKETHLHQRNFTGLRNVSYGLLEFH